MFAVTARDPGSVTLGPPGQIKITNRINSTEGYLGKSPSFLKLNGSEISSRAIS